MIRRKSYKDTSPGRGGWTQWLLPVMDGYLLTCCDCGLTHEMQFKAVLKVTPQNKRGYYKTADVLSDDVRVKFRARRAK